MRREKETPFLSPLMSALPLVPGFSVFAWTRRPSRCLRCHSAHFVGLALETDSSFLLKSSALRRLSLWQFDGQGSCSGCYSALTR